jgi:hypothetical protein
LARGGRKKGRKGIEEEKGRERRGGGGERYKEEEFRISLSRRMVGKKRRRELRQKTRRYTGPSFSCAVPS